MTSFSRTQWTTQCTSHVGLFISGERTVQQSKLLRDSNQILFNYKGQQVLIVGGKVSYLWLLSFS